MNTRTQPYLAELTAEVLFTTDVSSSPFPLVQVPYIYGRRSTQDTVVARYVTEYKRLQLTKQGLGANLRPMSFKDIEWGNHFVSLPTNYDAYDVPRD